MLRALLLWMSAYVTGRVVLPEFREQLDASLETRSSITVSEIVEAI